MLFFPIFLEIAFADKSNHRTNMTTDPLADNRCPNCNSPDIEWKDEYHLGWHCKLCGSSFYRPIEQPRKTERTLLTSIFLAHFLSGGAKKSENGTV